MIKTALLFAGQGAQVVGMGRDWARELPTARSWFDRANAALGYDLVLPRSRFFARWPNPFGPDERPESG